MRISEMYVSKQGEGLLTGTPSVFVRLSGCNLRCGFCDTPFASWAPEGDNFDVEKIVHFVLEQQVDHVVVTGGEPMIFKDLPDLCRELGKAQKHITIETAGTAWHDLKCDLMSISPKLSNSTPGKKQASDDWILRHEQRRYRPDIVSQMLDAYEYQLKFVVDKPEDLREIEGYLEKIPAKPGRVLLMPQGITTEELDERAGWLGDYCNQHGFVFCDRLHIRWYGNQRGT